MFRNAFVCLFLVVASVGIAAPARAQGIKAMKDNAVTNSVGMKFIYIPSGVYQMGASERGAQNSEMPQHAERVDHPFYLGMYEVTQAEYRKVMELASKNLEIPKEGGDPGPRVPLWGTPSTFSKSGSGARFVRGLNTDNFPVETVSWDDAQRFCNELSRLPAERQARRKYRLPTEIEWEYACRAGTTTAYIYGDELNSSQANVKDISGLGKTLNRTTAVGSYAPNAWGLYDMHGNVAEWCGGYYDPEAYGKIKTKKFVPSFEKIMRGVRGGSWAATPFQARSASREFSRPGPRNHSVGFRVVRIAHEEDAAP